MRLEAFIVGVLSFSGLIALGKSFGVAIFTGIFVSAILPWLMGLIPAFAWNTAIIFSLVWATLGYVNISEYLINSIDKIKENVVNSSNAVQPITGSRCSSCGTRFDVEVNSCGTGGVRQKEGAGNLSGCTNDNFVAEANGSACVTEHFDGTTQRFSGSGTGKKAIINHETDQGDRIDLIFRQPLGEV